VQLLKQLKNNKGRVLFVKGVIENHQTKSEEGHIIIYNFM
jgi:hypothetical protein